MRKGSCSEGSLQLGLWMAFRLTLVVSFVACQCMCNEGALPLERLAWKVFQLYRLSQASQVQPLGYGAGILFSTLSTDQLQLPARLSAYVAAFRALRPHRLQSVRAMLPQDALFVENEQAWLWAGEQLPCLLLVLPDMLPLCRHLCLPLPK